MSQALPVKEAWDPTHTSDVANHHWTTTNLGEAVPGVITPLCTAHWGLRGHRAAQRAAWAIGAISAAERDAELDPADRILRYFYGRVAVRLEYMTTLGDRMPGVTAEEMLDSLFGKAPPGMSYSPTVRRYPFIAARFTHLLTTIQPRLLAMCAETDAWWRRRVAEIPAMDLPAALATVEESLERYEDAITTHVLAMFGSFQPVFDMLTRLVERTGVGDVSVLSGVGGAEMAVVGDLWKASRGQIPLEQVIANHGFHGPGEGEVSSVVWREDPSPLRRVLEYYRELPDSEAVEAKERDKEARRVTMTRELLAAVPPWRRPASALVLKLARDRIPDRGRGKRSFLQGIDITRMAARRAGEHLASAGLLEDRDDVFYLTEHELLAPLPGDVKELVAMRRERRDLYGRITFPETTWAGMPAAEFAEAAPLDGEEGEPVINGTGASAGTAEGRVRVVTDPAFTEVEPGEILVAPTTDPSWCSIMFVSAALVVDLGGMLSHAAVVARELEIPCVVNTKDATRRLRTGDHVRVDGKAGTVEILARAAAPA